MKWKVLFSQKCGILSTGGGGLISPTPARRQAKPQNPLGYSHQAGGMHPTGSILVLMMNLITLDDGNEFSNKYKKLVMLLFLYCFRVKCKLISAKSLHVVPVALEPALTVTNCANS